MTLIEQIIAKNTRVSSVKAGDIVIVSPDCVMVHDIFIPFVVSKFREMDFERVWNTDKIAIIFDHMVPASRIEDVRLHKIGLAFAKEQGIEKLHKSDGVCHQIMVEKCYVNIRL